MLYPSGVIFKGSGYYTTDYKGKSAESNGSRPSSETKPETKSEPKPESKSDSSD